MRLADCLNASDIQTLRTIADHYQLECSKSSKNALMQSILAYFHQRSFAERVLTQTEDSSYREMIVQILLDKRAHFSREEILGLIKRMIGEKREHEAVCLQRLMREGWLYRLGSTARHIYYVPEDVRKKMRPLLSQMIQQQLEKPSEPPVAYRDENLAIVRDTTTFLTYVAKHECRLTQEGVLFKRHQTAILNLMEITEQPLGQVGWRFGYGRRFHEYPDRFALIYDYCYARQLISEQQETMILTCTPHVQAWMEQDDRSKLKDLFKFWRLTYRRPIPTLTNVLQRLAQAIRGEWVLLDSLNELLLPHVNDYYYDHKQQVLEKRIYAMLMHLGLLCQGQLEDGRTVIRLTEWGREILLEETVHQEEPLVRANQPLIIQPNFEILLPAEESGRFERELGQFSEVWQTGAMHIHRMTKQSMHRAFQEGWTAKKILKFLAEHADNPIPSNVVKQIQEWEKSYGKIVLYRVGVIECKDPQSAAELQRIPQVKAQIRGVLEDRYLLVPEEQLTFVAEQFLEMGYMPDLQF
jgi:hypothetical protein